MNRRAKGNKAEREAIDIYNAAGYRAKRVSETAGGRTLNDLFGLYDIVAMIPGRRIRFAQVKSNTGSGVRELFTRSDVILPPEHALVENLIRHDGEARGSASIPPRWRLQQPNPDGGEGSYQTVVDERKEGVPADGEGVADYIRQSGDEP